MHYCNVAVGAQQIKNSVNDMKSSIDLNQPTEKISESLIELETRNIKYAPEHCNRCNGCNTQAEGELVSPSLQGKYN